MNKNSVAFIWLSYTLANTLVDYFKNKIELIASNLEESFNTSSDQIPSNAPIPAPNLQELLTSLQVVFCF